MAVVVAQPLKSQHEADREVLTRQQWHWRPEVWVDEAKFEVHKTGLCFCFWKPKKATEIHSCDSSSVREVEAWGRPGWTLLLSVEVSVLVLGGCVLSSKHWVWNLLLCRIR